VLSLVEATVISLNLFFTSCAAMNPVSVPVMRLTPAAKTTFSLCDIVIVFE
jgi:hypothetical protein